MAELPIVTEQDAIQRELELARKAAKEQRRAAIGDLLTKAVDVLSDTMTSEKAPEDVKLRAAEVAVNLYTQTENAERQDKALELQEKRIDLESRKVAAQPLIQQNNLTIATSPEDAQLQRKLLTDRQQAQDAILSQYIKRPATPTIIVAAPDPNGGTN